MRDPLLAFNEIKQNFIRYVETAFRTQFPGLERERRALLNTDRVLCRQPWIEALPDYRRSGKTIADLSTMNLPSLSANEQRLFRGLASAGLFDAGIELYEHQREMLQQSLAGRHCIITSGTGSGKTESFLLPLFAQLTKELTHWAAPNAKSSLQDSWWRDNSGIGPQRAVDDQRAFRLRPAVQQRSHERRPAAMRALVLYPMNALVEDQMTRLRRALDAEPVRNWLTEYAQDNRIYFGRYNADTPIAGELRKRTGDAWEVSASKVSELKKRLRQLEAQRVSVEEQLITNPPTTPSEQTKARELDAFAARLDGAEMRSRFDMQIAPPDILITNYSMLSIMLMRQVDSPIFEKTRAWLAAEDEETSPLPEIERSKARESRFFHLIVDELHLYRGTAGSEVSYLIKLLLDRLGLHPKHPQLRILASSASLAETDPKAQEFIEDFFGLPYEENFNIIPGYTTPLPDRPSVPTLPSMPFAELADAFDVAEQDTSQPEFAHQCRETAIQIAAWAGCNVPGSPDLKTALLTLLTDPALQMTARLRRASTIPDSVTGETRERAVPILPSADIAGIRSFAEHLFGNNAPSELYEKATRGLLIARTLLDDEPYKSQFKAILTEQPIPRFRVHYFFRNLEGLWASVCANEITDANFADNQRTAGVVYAQPRIASPVGNRVLELLRCDSCGTTFFGGSRLLRDRGSTFELLPVSPNIEGVPEQTPAKLLENRCYQEYGIFWPSQQPPFDDVLDDRQWWRQATVGDHNQNEYIGCWAEAFLNRFSGDVLTTLDPDTAPQNWIPGYMFRVYRYEGTPTTGTPNWKREVHLDVALTPPNPDNPGEATHVATPCVCPSCGVNHRRFRNDSRSQKISSIRGFRTGFSKASQLYAKELLYQLPPGDDTRKVVAFSDSREDAAQIANGIERSHFTDLLREILLDELQKVITKRQLLDAAPTDDLRTQHPDLALDIDILREQAQLRFDANARDRAQAELNRIRGGLVSVRQLIGSADDEQLGPVLRRLVRLGVNPGGPNLLAQFATQNGQEEPWYRLIDSETGRWHDGVSRTFREAVIREAYEEMARVFLGSLFYSLEAAGLGYLAIDPTRSDLKENAESVGLLPVVFEQAVNSVIRLLCTRYKHNCLDPDFYRNWTPITREYFRIGNQVRNPVKRYIRAVADQHGVNATLLGEVIYDTLTHNTSSGACLTADRGIMLQTLFVHVAQANDPVYWHLQNRRPHLHLSAGVCSFSHERLPDVSQTTCSQLWEDNYLAFQATGQHRRDPMRLHCEEMTGQTDDQFERQRHFRDIYIGDEAQYQRAKSIDLLSVTTTLEVGVDIGALQAVMLANMPPQRFNYQQRVGRAGRRGQAYSLILTFCRGRSHDEFYFAHPERITGDPPPTPFLTMDQARIYRRILTKEVLRRAYTSFGLLPADEGRSNVHGEFGTTVNWNPPSETEPGYRDRLATWLTNHPDQIGEVVEFVLAHRPHEQAHQRTWLLDTQTQEGLLQTINRLINSIELDATDISERLAEGGALPMFGMPTQVKNLYHRVVRVEDGEPNESAFLAIDRSLDMALYEFAPGSQKTKDKAIHQVIGFTSDLYNERDSGRLRPTNRSFPGPPKDWAFALSRWLFRCTYCGQARTASQPITDTLCDCGNIADVVEIRTPRAYRTDLSRGRDERLNADIFINRPPIFAEITPEAPPQPQPVGNALVSLSDHDRTWRINDNDRQRFRGRYVQTENVVSPSNTRVQLYHQWIDHRIDLPRVDTSTLNGLVRVEQQDDNPDGFALTAGKHTEVLRISPRSIPAELNLDMLNTGNGATGRAGVRSAYYSAAFLLQRLLADRLDIDPNEVEIADIVSKEVVGAYQSGRPLRVGEIILADELPNGSGFVRYLCNHFEDLLTEALDHPQPGSFAETLFSPAHLHPETGCADVCYDCLKVYRNMNYHSLLDWRLGVSMLRLLQNGHYVAGADGRFDTPELAHWLADAHHLARSLANSFPERFTLVAGRDNLLPVLQQRQRMGRYDLVAVVHPLWEVDDNRAAFNQWLTPQLTALRDQASRLNGRPCFMDTFNIRRRVGWAYEKLSNRP